MSSTSESLTEKSFEIHLKCGKSLIDNKSSIESGKYLQDISLKLFSFNNAYGVD